ncbi:hypothetical protein TRVA0_031S00254 [Trichomonascus vanleenenianus]|uniref:NAD(P)H-dependent flavin oxidoreductase n=1 Tax=Trichomonascus vanleenenianus TaxID=2268995 RepID=UPI003EC9CCE6
MSISTPITKHFGVQHPIFLAGMNIAAGPRLVAAVTNAGGIGVLGAASAPTPDILDSLLVEMKSYMNDPENGVFGVDFLLPKIGGGARKTNKAYHVGPIKPFLDVLIKHKAKLVVSAVGAPSQDICDYLHEHGIMVMCMIGAVKHLKHLLGSNGSDIARVDMICCQGGEGGGHTGSIPSTLLIPSVVDAVKGFRSKITGEQVQVVAAGGMYCGRSLAAALSYGASAVWVGTRFVATEESGAPMNHKRKVLNAGFDDTVRTLIYTGRPLRVYRTKYVNNWEQRKDEIAELTSKGVIPYDTDLENENYDPDPENDDEDDNKYLMGETAAVVKAIVPAKQVVDEIMAEAVAQINRLNSFQSKL